MFDSFLSNPFSHLAGILSFITVIFTIYLQSKKAGASDVDKLVSGLNKKVKDLQKTDIDHQKELNDKEIRIQQLLFKNSGLEARLGDYWKILQNRNPELEKTLETLVDSNIEILKKLEGAEIVDESEEVRV